MDNLIHQPSLAFAFTQAGQENSFGWDAMKSGLTMQVALLAQQARDGKIQIETLAEAGKWFRQHFSITPATSVVALDDWKHENRKSVWYDSRFYRLNLLWENGSFFIRDLHRFDETVASVTHDSPLTTTYLACGTLPIMDGALWSGADRAGIKPICLGADGQRFPLQLEGPPVVKELNRTDLSVTQPLRGGGAFFLVCREDRVAFFGVDAQRQPLPWAFDLVGGERQKSAVQSVEGGYVQYHGEGVDYKLLIAPGEGSCEQLPDGAIRISPDKSGKLVLILSNGQ
jgi:hypothetical protein